VRAKTGIFKKPTEHRLGSRHQKRDCGASLNVQEYAAEKNIDVEENLQPKHSPNQ